MHIAMTSYQKAKLFLAALTILVTLTLYACTHRYQHVQGMGYENVILDTWTGRACLLKYNNQENGSLSIDCKQGTSRGASGLPAAAK